MSSTHVNLTNKSDITILTKLIWGFSEISKATIKVNDSGTLGAEYVWYDLQVFNNNTQQHLLQQNAIYGNSSWIFAGNVHEGYFITQA